MKQFWLNIIKNTCICYFSIRVVAQKLLLYVQTAFWKFSLHVEWNTTPVAQCRSEFTALSKLEFRQRTQRLCGHIARLFWVSNQQTWWSFRSNILDGSAQRGALTKPHKQGRTHQICGNWKNSLCVMAAQVMLTLSLTHWKIQYQRQCYNSCKNGGNLLHNNFSWDRSHKMKQSLFWCYCSVSAHLEFTKYSAQCFSYSKQEELDVSAQQMGFSFSRPSQSLITGLRRIASVQSKNSHRLVSYILTR